MEKGYCSKCGNNASLTKVNIGAEETYIKTESYFCWKCFNTEFIKAEEECLYEFKD